MAVAEKIPTLEPAAKNAEQEAWVNAVDTLIADATEWAHKRGWRTIAREKQIVDETTQQEYATADLDIITDPDYSGHCREIKLVIAPIFFDAARKSSRVDFSVWPASYDVILLYDNSRHEWTLKGDSRYRWPSSWDQGSFGVIAERLLEMA